MNESFDLNRFLSRILYYSLLEYFFCIRGPHEKRGLQKRHNASNKGRGTDIAREGQGRHPSMGAVSRGEVKLILRFV